MSSLIPLIRKFIQSSPIKRKIAWFYEHHGNGFEKWFQFELMYWLSKKSHNVTLEQSVGVDGRRTNKTKNQIDMVVRMKSQSKQVSHAVELKVTIREAGAVRKAINDLIRLDKCLESKWNFRSVSAVAVCANQSGNRYEEFLDALKETNKTAWMYERFPIPSSDAVIYVFGWHAPPRKANKSEYHKFIQHLKQTAKELGITAFRR
ncbi:hypothetical protein B9Z39_07880 [Limnohabitans sp. JirII-29]|uniref:hypothetical protein n=1 Tax=Limnohabitans sp. JirII-29 TaxID=1835756 RepID=UPI000D3925A0|nr:hypothetical protein [Limnohabitans sp. JirII-29]PUE27666.1 hypothetical protein B9Z39_07880 [Limnohabitans sp. JirII-29]